MFLQLYSAIWVLHFPLKLLQFLGIFINYIKKWSFCPCWVKLYTSKERLIMRKYFALSFVMALLVVFVYGCGDKKDDKTNKDGNTTDLI